MTDRIAQVSDAHLSASKPAFADNVGRIAEAIRAERFDRLLATGDLNLLGEDSEEELAYGVAQHAAIGPEMLCVPGNHDVGNDPALDRNADLGSRSPALVISGHVHPWRDRVADGMRQVWALSTAFVLGDAWQPACGTRVIGWVEHAFHPDGTHDARLRTVDRLALNDIAHMPQVYRPMPTLAERPDLWKKYP